MRTLMGSRIRACLAGGGVAALAALTGFAVAQTTGPRFEPQVERRISLYEVLLETVRVETQVQGWTLRKVCLDGQAYWVGFNETAPTGLAVAYKNREPEQCGRK